MKLEKDDLIKLYKNMVLGRKLDQITIEGLATGKVLSFFHSGQGSEGLAAGVASFLRDDDYLYGHHRGHGIVYLVSKNCSGMEFLAEREHDDAPAITLGVPVPTPEQPEYYARLNRLAAELAGELKRMGDCGA